MAGTLDVRSSAFKQKEVFMGMKFSYTQFLCGKCEDRQMPRITWDDSFSVHNGDIDEQHKQWIAIINDLYDAMDSDEGISRSVIIQALKAVDHYTRFHFEDEEAFMRSVNYPEYEAHKKLHESLLKVVEKYMDDIEHDRVNIDEVMDVLTKWFPNHILKEDIKFASYGKD